MSTIHDSTAATTGSSSLRFELRPMAGVLEQFGTAWDTLAEDAGNPYLSRMWLEAFCATEPRLVHCLIGVDESGRLRTGATVGALRPIGLTSVGRSPLIETWGALGPPWARAQLWRALAARAHGRLHLTGLRAPDDESEAREVQAALAAAGYTVSSTVHNTSPRIALPGDWDTFLAARSRNTRQNLRRRRQQLERQGAVRLRTAQRADIADQVEAFFRMEASGWKGRGGTAILSSSGKSAFYRRLCSVAASQDRLLMRFLDVGDTPVAAELGLMFAGGRFSVKIAFDERWGANSPGFVMYGECIRDDITHGFDFVDCMGEQDEGKRRWGAVATQMSEVHAYRGPAAPAMTAYRRSIRPRLKNAYHRARTSLTSRVALTRPATPERTGTGEQRS